MKILAVMAHPDDEAFAISGTIKKLTLAGHEVVLVETTDGGAGRAHPVTFIKLEKMGSVKSLRKEELWKSAESLGVKTIYFFDYPDGSLSNGLIYENGLVDKIVDVIKSEEPEIVIAYDQTGISWHLDHIATSLATSKAVTETKNIVDKFFMFVPPEDMKPIQDYVVMLKFKPSHFVDVSDLVKYKRKSIKAHKSQRYDWERFFARKPNRALEKENFYLVSDMKRLKKIFNFFTKYKTS